MSSGVAALSHQGAFQATLKGSRPPAAPPSSPGRCLPAGTSPAGTTQAQEALQVPCSIEAAPSLFPAQILQRNHTLKAAEMWQWLCVSSKTAET